MCNLINSKQNIRISLQITGMRLGLFFRTASSLASTLIVAFVFSWELSALMIIIFPFMFLNAIGIFRLSKRQEMQNRRKLEESSQTAVESVDNIRTVVGLGAEEMFFNKFRKLTAECFRYNNYVLHV